MEKPAGRARSCMTGKIFLDTNIIVYAHDRSSGEKNRIAEDILLYLWESKRGILSTQVMQEFYVIITRKIPSPLPIMDAKKILEYFMTWQVVINDTHTVLQAIDIQKKHGFSFWDSLILQSSIQGNADILFSEDMSDGLAIENLKIINPFLRDWKKVV